jgi:hypothetical protein
MAACPCAEELLRLVEGQVETVHQARIVAHLETCAWCQSRLEELTRVQSADDRTTNERRLAGYGPALGTVELTADFGTTVDHRRSSADGCHSNAIADSDLEEID